MAQVKYGDWVQVHYTGRLQDGQVFDKSDGRPPLEFQVGGGQVIPGFEQGVLGMNSGETKTVTIDEEDGYGPHRNDMVLQVDRSDFPSGVVPEVGQQLRLQRDDGFAFLVTVMSVSDTKVTLDANHPLAGKELIFDIQIIGISVEPTMDHSCAGCHHDEMSGCESQSCCEDACCHPDSAKD